MPRILVAEDSSMNRNMIVRRLASEGFEVLTASNGKEAIKVAQSSAPELILMDLAMPEMDGWEAATIIRSGELTSKIPMLALSGLTQADSIVRARTAGFDGFETKPVDFRRLVTKINSLISERTPEAS